MSSRGRAVVSSVSLAVLIGLSGACGSSQSYTAAKNARSAEAKAAAAAKAKIEAEKRRLAQARQRAAAQRRALAARKAAIAARLRERQRRAAQGTTTTTTVPTPTTAPGPTPTDPGPITDPHTDLAAVQTTLDDLNRAFRVGVADGIAASETANYWVDSGVYSGRQCAAFEAAQGGGAVRESLSVHPGSFRADPSWTDPVVGSKPKGRVYALVVDDLQTLVPTGEQRRRSSPIHVTVMPDGRALLFLRCR